MRITAYTPPEAHQLSPDKSKELVNAAIDKGNLDQLPLAPEVGWLRKPMFLGDVLATKISDLVEKTGESAGKLYGRLLHAGLKDELEKKKTEEIKPETLKVGRFLQPEQELMINRSMVDIQAKRISLCEASTGTGKSYSMAVIAERALYELGLKKVIVTAPTLSILRQNYLEWTETGSLKQAALILGRKQFVDPIAIKEMLDNGYEDAAVEAWYNQGGGDVGNPTTNALRQTYPDIRWLTDDLHFIAKDFPVKDVELDETASKESEYWYQHLKDSAETADIIFCTHMMVALDNQLKSRKTSPSQILPDADLMLIDEIHQFEQAVANAACKGLALSKLKVALAEVEAWTSLRLTTKAKEALNKCSLLIQTLQYIPEDHFFELSIHEDKYKDQRFKIEAAAIELIEALKALNGKKLESTADTRLMKKRVSLLYAIQTLEAFLSGKQRAHLTFAPLKRYPTLSVGPLSVRHLMVSLWERTPAAVLFSASIGLPTQHGTMNDGYLKTILALPHERVNSQDPIIPHWVTNTVTLHIPSALHAESLLPPARKESEMDTDANLTSWSETMALEITEQVIPNAQGGILVLVPSREGVKRIGTMLQTLINPERVIIQTELPSVNHAKEVYLNLYQKGIMPIWVGTGPAWTGLDLSDKNQPDPELDLLLTDLVLTRIPFGVNRSTTQAAREQWMGYRAFLSEAMMQFKQGIGRLIRRKGLKDRHLWILDGRISSKSHVKSMKIAKALLVKYTKRSEF